jgi:hypothetical protein
MTAPPTAASPVLRNRDDIRGHMVACWINQTSNTDIGFKQNKTLRRLN